MNAVWKWLTVSAASLLLLACGSKEEDGPPTLDEQDLGVISPYDTLQAVFSDAVRMPNSDNVISATKIKVIKAEGKSLYLGGDSTVAGFSFLQPGTDYTVTFKSMESDAGEVQSADQKLSFTTLPVLDSDFTQCVAASASLLVCRYNDALDMPEKLMNDAGTAFFDGALPSEGVTVAGMLAAGKMRDASKYGKNDYEDNYILKLKMGDTVVVVLSGLRQNLDLQFMGPRNKSDSLDFFPALAQTSALEGVKTDSLRYVIGLEHMKGTLTSSYTELVDYAIRVYFKDANPAGASPYRLSVQVRPYRN